VTVGGGSLPDTSRLDPTLVHRATRGDAVARGELVRTLGPSIWGLCRRLCHDPDDAYQNVWERVFRALPGFDPQGAGSLRAWVLTITHRHLVDRHRRRRTRGEVVPLDALPPDEPAMDDDLDAEARRRRLEAAVRALHDAQRRVVVLHHLEGVPLETIAREEGVAVGTVKSRLHRGRARLLTLLGGTR
jgi:RNA polymerase sigma-70 factor (ECF subfamily)